MNYQASLTRLQDRQKELWEKGTYQIPSRTTTGNETLWKSEKKRAEWELVKSVAEGYSQSFSAEISNDKIEEVFSEVESFAKPKERVKSFFLAKKYSQSKNIKFREKGEIICLVGPPGTGKTFFASKFAEALGRKFFPLPVGGKNSPKIIFGSQQVWVGSQIGGIVRSIQETKSCDPVVLIDEVDKIGENRQEGSLKDALLHVLDPEQNKKFQDDYFGTPLDISRITFLLTANELDKIPEALKSRLEVIEIKGYTEEEKLAIAEKIIEKIFSENYENANRDLFEMGEGALRLLISKTSEEGVRQLKKKIEVVIRWCFSQWIQQYEKGETETKLVIDENKVNEIISENPEKKGQSEEDKLREQIEELEKENEDLKQKPSFNLSLFKSLSLSENKERCEQHQKTTCQTVSGDCALCELEEQIKQLEAVITQENSSTCKQIWGEQKAEWVKQAEKLQKGAEEEKELARQIRAGIAKIQKKFQQVQKAKHSSTNSQPNKGSKDLPWIIGGGIMLVLIGWFYGWLLTRSKKKKTPFWRKNNPEKPLLLGS